jgi:hypothetical protein
MLWKDINKCTVSRMNELNTIKIKSYNQPKNNKPLSKSKYLIIFYYFFVCFDSQNCRLEFHVIN